MGKRANKPTQNDEIQSNFENQTLPIDSHELESKLNSNKEIELIHSENERIYNQLREYLSQLFCPIIAEKSNPSFSVFYYFLQMGAIRTKETIVVIAYTSCFIGKRGGLNPPFSVSFGICMEKGQII